MVPLISRDELKAAIAAGSVTVIDALDDTYYRSQHLPGARNLVAEEVGEKAPHALPNRDAAIVTYCSNAVCGNSEAVAKGLIALGYTDVRKYREGIQDWVDAGLPTESGDETEARAR